MDTAEHIKLLQTIDLFEAFSTEELLRFAGNVEEVRYGADEILCREGETGREMFILLRGSLRVFKESRAITVIRPVDYIGEMAIIESKPRSATVQAAEDSLLLRITQEQFQEYLTSQPASLVSLVKTLSRRIRHDTQVLAAEFEKTNILIHDMKNFLSTFLFLEVLEKRTTEESSHKFIRFMQDASKNLKEMMDEALAGAKRMQYQPVMVLHSLNDLILEMSEAEFPLHGDLQDKKIVLSLPDKLPEFPFNRLALRRVLTNLVVNAGQASLRGDSIEIAVRHVGDQTVVRVIDHGGGIPEQLQDMIFSPHFTTKKDGNGLGLASCKQIVETMHGGSLRYESKPGAGTEFIVSLPMSQPAESPKGDEETVDHG